ncbi:MAG: tryptophan-rich sensory protein [Candidatus Niyogibacteria bacterium]|nr:tryptophan-rich sensory protein [Candidatus Niyogibacteria bacterium]
MQNYSYYSELVKPAWAPPAGVFGPVWAALYIIIAISFGYAAMLYFKKRIPFSVLLPFLLNLGFNLAFTPLQFGLRNDLLASADVLLVLATLAWAMYAIRSYARWIAYANIPYFLWVAFATVLQLTITAMN